MPVYDRGCDVCGWETDFALEPVTDPKPPCPQCGASTHRFMSGHAPMCIPDTFNTPVVDSVMTKHKQVHYTRSERKARMKNNKLQEFIKWSSGNESDKSNVHGPRWDAVSADQLRSMERWMKERYPDATEQVIAEPK